MEVARLAILFLAISLDVIIAMLDVSPTATDSLVDSLRSHIFVDSRHIIPIERAHVCDSLSGPNCAADPLLEASGVVPQEYLGSLQVDFSVLHRALPLEVWAFDYSGVVPDNFVLPNPTSLLLSDLPEGGRITSHYSMSLPSGAGVAKLEGRWLLEDSVSMETFLPAYMRFSEPVLVSRLWAELTVFPELDTATRPLVIVAFRLGTETVWTTEAIVDRGFTMDLTSRGADGHGPLRACDQIVIYSTVRGLKIASVEFESAPEQVLVPAVLLVPGAEEGTLAFKADKVDSRLVAAKRLVSVKDAIREGHKLAFPARVNRTQILAEVVARDANVLLPVEQVFKMVKSGQLALPHELKKAILKQEASIHRLSQAIAQRAIQALVSPEAAPGEESSSLQTISDLFIAALMHL